MFAGLLGAATMLLVVAVAVAVALSLGMSARSTGAAGGGDPVTGLAAPQFLTSAEVGNRLLHSLSGPGLSGPGLSGPGLSGVVPGGFAPVAPGQGHTGPMTLAGESAVFARPAQVRAVLTNDGFTGGYRRAWVLPGRDRAIVVSGYAFATPAGAADWMQVLLLGAAANGPVAFSVGTLSHAVGYRIRESTPNGPGSSGPPSGGPPSGGPPSIATLHDEVVMLQMGRLTFQVIESGTSTGRPTTEVLALARAQMIQAGSG